MKSHQSAVGKSDVWGTPEWILKPLGEFDLDPCAMRGRELPCVTNHWHKEDDGLSKQWSGRIWMNPPFNRYQRPTWMRRMAEHNHGTMLVPAACETMPFITYVFGKAAGVLMLNRRPKFVGRDGSEAKANSGCTICLVAYGEEDYYILRHSGLGTMLKRVA